MGMLCLLVPIVALSSVLMRVSVSVCMTVGMRVNNVAMRVLLTVLMCVGMRVRLLLKLVRAVRMGVRCFFEV